MPRTVVMMISELDYEIMNNEVVFFFLFSLLPSVFRFGQIA